MPEGDTVWRTARRLHRVFAGQVLTRAELRWGERSGEALLGRRTLEVASRGKHLLHRLEGGLTLHSHLRMEGQWRIEAVDGVHPRDLADHRLRALLATSQWVGLGYRLGVLELLDTAAEQAQLAHLGPDLLGPDWDLTEAVRRLQRHPERPVGAALLDQRNLAGIGTLYAAESLFLEARHPWSPVGDLDESALTGLVERARRLLLAGRDHAVQATTGVRRRGETTYVHGRSGRSCRRCGGTVRVAMIGEPPRERTMFSCPTCQGGCGPTDDGRVQRPLGSTPRRR